jgi:predicted small metal-binding protein
MNRDARLRRQSRNPAFRFTDGNSSTVANPSEMNCTVAFSADSDEELLEVAVQHAVQVHHHKDSPELRQQIRNLFKEGTPPLETPRHSA